MRHLGPAAAYSINRRLPGKGSLNSHGARPVDLIIMDSDQYQQRTLSVGGVLDVHERDEEVVDAACGVRGSIFYK